MQVEMIAMLESGIDPKAIIHLLIAREGQKLFTRLQRQVLKNITQAMEYNTIEGCSVPQAMCEVLEQAATSVCREVGLT